MICSPDSYLTYYILVCRSCLGTGQKFSSGISDSDAYCTTWNLQLIDPWLSSATTAIKHTYSSYSMHRKSWNYTFMIWKWAMVSKNRDIPCRLKYISFRLVLHACLRFLDIFLSTFHLKYKQRQSYFWDGLLISTCTNSVWDRNTYE